MPRLSEKIPIKNEKLDRRVKLTTEQKREVVSEHAEGWSMRKLAILFKVDRKTIANIIYPERYQAQLAQHSLKKTSQKYYNRERHNLAMKIHRKYKQELYKKGLI